MEDYIYQDNLCLIKTKKYKSINLYLNFIKEYDEKTKLVFNLLARFLGEYSLAYPNKESMTKAKDMLYGASLSAGSKVKTNLVFLTLKYSFINPKFLKDVSLAEYLAFFKECFEKAFFSQDLLVELKQNYKDSLLRHLDKPSSFASNRICQILANDNALFSIYDIDQIKLLDSITLEDVKNTYESLLKDCCLKNFIVGDYDDQLVEFMKSYQNDKSYKLSNESLTFNDLGEIIESKDVSQSCLIVSYATPSNRLNKDYYAYFLGNALLGMIPTSFLFNDVREKLSLCYYIGVSEYKNEGLVRILTMFDAENKDLVVAKINEEMKRLIDMSYQAEELETAKVIMKDNLNSTLDSNDSLVDYLLIDDLNGLHLSLKEYGEKLDQVTKEDIASVFKNYKHVLTYLLKGEKHETDL